MAEFSSPITTGLRVRRTRVSSFSFLNRPQDQQPREDYGTTLALQQNRLAFDNINSSLINLSNQVSALSASLNGIAERVREDSALDQARESQKIRQEEILAEQKIREGKESVVERKMQSALLTPIKKVGDKARFTLGRLGQFFMILLGGFLGNIALQTISSLVSGNKEKLDELKQSFLKNIGVVTGIFLLFSGGFRTILGYLTRLTAKLGSSIFRNLLIRPVNALLNLVKTAAAGIAAGIGLKPKTPPKTPPAKPKPSAPPAKTPPGGKAGSSGAPPASSGSKGSPFGSSVLKGGLFAAGASAIYDTLFGSSVGEMLAGSGTGFAAGGALSALNYVLGPKFTIPLTIAGTFAIPALIGLGKEFYKGSDIGKDNPFLNTEINLLDAFTGQGPLFKTPSPEINAPPKKSNDNLQSLKSPDSGGNVTVINNESTASARNAPTQDLGSANYLPSIATSDPDNFHKYTSYRYFNTGWA